MSRATHPRIIPTEIWDLCWKNLQLPQDFSTLRNLSQVCKVFCAICQPRLFRDFVGIFVPPDYELSTALSLRLNRQRDIFALVSSNSYLRKLILSCKAIGSYQLLPAEQSQAPEQDVCTAYTDALLAFISSLPSFHNLVALTLVKIDIDDIVTDALSSLPNLRELLFS